MSKRRKGPARRPPAGQETTQKKAEPVEASPARALKPRRRLLIALSVVLVVWIGVLLAIYFACVR